MHASFQGSMAGSCAFHEPDALAGQGGDICSSPIFLKSSQGDIVGTPWMQGQKIYSCSPSTASTASTPISGIAPCIQEHIENSVLDKSRRRIWVHGPRPEYKKNSQRYNLPSRILPLLRPGLDLVILPGAHQPTREFWNFCCDALGFDESQAIFTSGNIYNMDDDVDDNMIHCMQEFINSSDCDWTVIPYCVTPNFQRWLIKLKETAAHSSRKHDIAVFGDEVEWVERFGHKGVLHRHISSLDTPSLIETIDPTILVARGYTCTTPEDLMHAHQLLGQPEKVVIKPVHGAAGEGIVFVSCVDELRDYKFPMGDVCLEEFLNLDLAADGVVLSPALHYGGSGNSSLMLGDRPVDQIMQGTSYMGWRPTAASPQFCARAAQVVKPLLTVTELAD
mmetsp:Transcript_70722/g.188787  ORF Transcript_70722/g.188787 Transcript_70722/m.188787 type:complete len:392 (-) Transcript_70722:160-1335(-)